MVHFGYPVPPSLSFLWGDMVAFWKPNIFLACNKKYAHRCNRQRPIMEKLGTTWKRCGFKVMIDEKENTERMAGGAIGSCRPQVSASYTQ
mmetsp:Transcript_36798/g.75044  ORF Transcript_36798/g.75044 Transcript_36798/m.75044 type:complete len:90 (+) Transcript_36798:120-389(+)